MKKQFNLKIITTPIIMYLLSDYIRFPRFFLLRCKLTISKMKKQIGKEFPEDLINLVAMPLWVYINLKNKIGRDLSFEIMRIAILTVGVVKQNFLFETVGKGRRFDLFKDQELEINKTGTTKWNTLRVIESSPDRFELEVSRCLFHELTTHLGIPEATKLICQVDNAVFNSYLPEEILFHRRGLNKRISDGSTKCHFLWEKIS